jgi:hypothetical protein
MNAKLEADKNEISNAQGEIESITASAQVMLRYKHDNVNV